MAEKENTVEEVTNIELESKTETSNPEPVKTTKKTTTKKSTGKSSGKKKSTTKKSGSKKTTAKKSTSKSKTTKPKVEAEVKEEVKAELNSEVVIPEPETFNKKEKGKKLEVERIKAIWENANLLLGVYENHPEIFASQFNSFTWGEREIVGNFAIDLSKLTGSSNEISNAFKIAVTNEETYEVTYTVEGLYLFIGNNYDINGDLDYESLAYLRTIIEKYTNFVGA